MSYGSKTATAGVDGTTVWLGLGTNLGDPGRNLAAALRGLSEAGVIEAVSSVWASEPVGYRNQPGFWNLAIRLRTGLSATALLTATKRIEADVGRRPTFPQGPRIIDIDILLYGSMVIDEPDLQVPHPRMLKRGFVLRPLLELDPDLVDPRSGERLKERLDTGTFERTEPLFPGSELLSEP
jgi:2-amino-4-hydroxy-6-hydroxymethyldihydropteridine diphosphokinase